MLNDPSVRIALVGGGGFIGSHLLSAVLERTAWRVLAVDFESSKISEYLNSPRVEFLRADIADASVMHKVAECGIVVNLAAICTPARYMKEATAVIESNFTHPAALATACAASGAWFIHFSTSEVYGKTSADAVPLKEDSSPFVRGSVCASRWSYACAKELAERWIASLGGLRYTVVRPFNFVGPRMDFMPGVDGSGIPRVLANFCSAIVRGESPVLVNGGTSRRSFTSVRDAVNFMFALFAHREQANGEAFNVGNPANECTIAELAHKLQTLYSKITGVPFSSLPLPRTKSALEFYGEGYEDSLRRIPDVSKAERLLGWTPEIALDGALEESLAWFIRHYAVCG